MKGRYIMNKLVIGALVVTGVGAFAYWMLSDRKASKEMAISENNAEAFERLQHEL
jgi:hypothetical protein